MPNLRLLFTFLILIAGTAKAADLGTRVSEVTLYPSGAMVTRTVTVDIPAGESELRLTGLANNIEPEFLQVEISAPDVRIGQVRLSAAEARDAVNASVTALQEKIVTVRTEIQAVADSSAAAERRLKFLDSLAEGYAKASLNSNNGGATSIGSLRAALELLQSGSEDASRLIRDNRLKQSKLQKDVSVLERELAVLNGGALSTVTAAITVNADRATRGDIRLRYYQEDARWYPIYEARLDSYTGALELAQQARVEQATDESWDSVILTLSTSYPSGDLISPEVDSEFLDIVQPAPARNVDMLKRSAGISAAAAGLEEVVVTASRIRASVGDFAVNYSIPGRTTVSNDSDEAITLDLERFQFATELVTRIVPRQNTQAFLTARFTYTDSLPLYQSEMRVYVDGVFSGLSEMPTALPQTEVTLPMGQDRRVEVKSEIKGGEDGTRGVIGRRKSEVTDYVFEITNRREKPSVIEVVDRIPVARNRDIDVEVPKSATEPTERDIDDQPGLVIWSKNLDGGESWRIRHQYTVSYPAKMRLIRRN